MARMSVDSHVRYRTLAALVMRESEASVSELQAPVRAKRDDVKSALRELERDGLVRRTHRFLWVATGVSTKGRAR
jgi:DNA-binding MarR family transcriptional regulator